MTERTDELANEVAAKVVADELKQAVEEEAEVAAAPSFEVILASNSPRRRELLNAAGVKFTVRTPVTPVDESLEPDLAADPEEAAKKLAERKAGAVIQEVLAENYTGMLIVIGADTMVGLDGKIFGKPRSASDGKHMLRQLSGRTHEVITAVSVWMVAAPNAEDVSLGFRTFADISHVTFRDLTDEESPTTCARASPSTRPAPTPSKVRGRRSLTTTTAPLTLSSACLRHASSRNSPTS